MRTVSYTHLDVYKRQILQSFYGSDINFVTGAPLSPNLGGSFPGVTLRLGDFSEDVRTVQTRLNRISTNFPNIPKIYPCLLYTSVAICGRKRGQIMVAIR